MLLTLWRGPNDISIFLWRYRTIREFYIQERELSGDTYIKRRRQKRRARRGECESGFKDVPVGGEDDGSDVVTEATKRLTRR